MKTLRTAPERCQPDVWHGVEAPREKPVPDAPSLSGRRVAALASLAALLHGLFDAITYRFPAVRPPYLRLEDAPEAFQMLSPVAVSISASCVSGLIATIVVIAVEPNRRRPALLGALVTGFWIFSAALMRTMWLSTAWSTVGTALLCGIPRGLVIGALLAWLSLPRGVSASTGAGA